MSKCAQRLKGRARASTAARAGCLAALVLATTLSGCDADSKSAQRGGTPADASARQLPALLATVGSRSMVAGEAPRPADIGTPAAKSSPSWPVDQFLRAEAQNAGPGPAAARGAYRALAEWAAKDPYRDGWGGSSLAVVALWRWLRSLEPGTAAEAAEVRRALEVGETLLGTRLARGLFQPREVIEVLPQLEEDIARRSATLAWNVGDRQDARRLIVRYLAIARDPGTSPVEEAMIADAVANGLVTRDWLAVFRGRRLRSIGRYAEAKALLEDSLPGAGREARAAAGLELAKIEPILDDRKRGADRGSVAARLSAVIEAAGDPEVVQDARYFRALLLKREGPGRDLRGFEESLTTLVAEFPRGRLADNALYELARQAEDDADTPRALELYARLRRFEGPNDWIDSSYFRPAMALYARAGSGDLPEAAALLRELVDRYPSGPFRLKSLFWQGRIAHESGDLPRGRGLFEQVVREGPYDYYALRARLWLALGAEARREVWLDAPSREAFRAAYGRGPAAGRPAGTTPYHARIGSSVESGLYGAALGEIPRLQERFPGQRLETLPLEMLDREGALARVAVLLALRQDALAAADADDSVEGRVAIAALVGHGARDLPLAVGLMRDDESTMERRNAVQRSANYIATAYPPAFADEIRGRARERDVRPELVYGIIRQESLFNATALSRAGALGLFQFTPSTFARLDERWHVLAASRAASREAFLASPELSIALGVRWLREELLPAHRGNVALAIMEQNAGRPAVLQWRRGWERMGRQDDVEYMVETIRFAETHLFTRRVLADVAIVDAVGLFDGEGSRTR